MFGIAVLAAALMTMAAVGPCQAQEDKPEARPCRYTQSSLTFNPWDAWNIYSLNNLYLFGTQVQGKVAASNVCSVNGGQVNTVPSTFATQPPFAVTSEAYAIMQNLAVVNGGIDVQEGLIVMQGGTVHGDLRAGGPAPSSLTSAVVSGVFTTMSEPNLSGDPDRPAGGVNVVLSDLPKTVDFANLDQYFGDLTTNYRDLDQDVAKLDVSTVLTDGIIRVTLHNQVNVVRVSPEDIAAANKIILSGISNAVLIINIDTVVDVRINKLDVVYEGARGRVGEPTFNRVLLNFPDGGNVALGKDADGGWYDNGAHLHVQGKESTANHTEIEAQARAIHAEYAKRTHARVAGDDLPAEKHVMHFSVLAPSSLFTVDNVIVKGNLVGRTMGFMNGAEVHTQPWGRFAPPQGGSLKPRQPRQPSKVRSNCLWGNI